MQYAGPLYKSTKTKTEGLMKITSLLFLLLSRFSRVQLYATPQTAAHQAPPSLGFSRLENPTGVGCHFPLQCMKVKSESEVAQLCPTPWTAAYQAPPSMGFSKQDYWSGLPLPSLDDFLGHAKKSLQGSLRHG